MSIFVLILLCIVQGLTEFLPVSSSGHLLLVEQVFKVQANLLFLNLFLHLATLFAVIFVFRKTIFTLIKKPFQPLTYKLILSTIITAIFAFLYKKLNINSYVFIIYGPCFVLTALILFLTDKYQKNAVIIKQKTVSIKSAILVGAVQGFAVLPGLSRSGVTISSLVCCGMDEGVASSYSFLLSIPIIVGGFVFECLEIKSWESVFSSISAPLIFFAFLLTFFVAIISLKLTIKILKAKKLNFIALYLFVLGVIVSIYNFILK